MRTALEELALAVAEDGWANASDGDTTTFGRAFWWSEIDSEFIAAYDEPLSDKYGEDESLTSILNDAKHGMFAVLDSDGNIAVTLTDMPTEAQALYEDMLGNYQDFVAESEQNAREDTDTINELRFE